MNIAIDGPAGAGKSTIAKKLAATLGILYLDTGALYRTVALKMLKCDVRVDDEQNVARVLAQTKIEVRYEEGAQRVYLDGEDVGDRIRENHVSAAASAVAALPCVRSALLSLQRDIAHSTDTVLDGRDIGSFVLPDADCKFYLTASVDERARRRYAELTAKGTACTIEEIRKDIEARDYNDMHRAVSPLVKAQDAVVVDSSDMTPDEVADYMLRIVREKR